MMTAKTLDDFIREKLGDRDSMSSSELILKTDDEYFLFLKASIRMLDEEATDCPYTITLQEYPHEIRCGRYMIPCSTIRKKSVYIVKDESDNRLIGDKHRLSDRIARPLRKQA